MLDFLIDLLTPVFVSMGASASDVVTYVNLLGGYIYAILGALVLLIAVLIGAHFVKKGTRHVVRWTAVVAFFAAILILVNAICYGPMYGTVSMFLNSARVEISDDVAGESKQVIKETAEEGMVLVKNNGLLPLSSDVNALNVFGWASVFPVYNGTGSASNGTAADQVSLLQSLNDAGYQTNGTLTDMYANYGGQYVDGRPSITMTEQFWYLPEPTKEYYTDSIMSEAEAFSDVAVVVIARGGGENADLPTDMNAVLRGKYNITDNTSLISDGQKVNYNYTHGSSYNNSSEYADFEAGEHFLELSATEEIMIDTVCEKFKKVIVVINASNPMELSWVDEHDEIGAVILLPGPGSVGMTALGEIINGTVNPSGKTVDTYVRDLTDTVTWYHSGNSGNNIYTNIGDEQKQIGRTDATFQGAISYTDYVEGIYTGYKYYETASDDGVINYYEKVQYPFGYGLSYTTFEKTIKSFEKKGDVLNITVEVTNTGSVAGKDVAELYFTPPYTNGGIEKASVNLLDFEKTNLLQPGEKQTLSFSIPVEDMASYDSSCIKTENGGYILEAGEYVISLRSDSHTVVDSRSFTLDADIDYSKTGRASDAVTANNLFSYAEITKHEVLSRKDGFANYDKAAAKPDESELTLSAKEKRAIKSMSVFSYDPKDYDDPADEMPVTGANNGLKLADLAGKSYDDENWEKLLDQLTVSDMQTLINVGAYQTSAIESVGKAATTDCDGPSGLSNYATGANGTQFTSEILMAQCWSKEMASRFGSAIGQEFAAGGVYGWYGPAMNLHRTAFGGRNFEYYSEDAVLSGKIASEEVNGAAKYGVYAYIKHFAANDQETNRCAFLLTYMTEQSFRENMLKPFEIVVKNFNYTNNVLAVMSSYNWIGNIPACMNSNLLTDLLRGEWGFKGMVISDYDGSYGYMMTDGCVRAGNDLMLGYGLAESNKLTDTESATLVKAMRRASKNILYTVGNSGLYKDASAVQEGGADNMTKLFTMVNVIAGAILVAVEAIVVIRFIVKKKKQQEA